jgi:hypothetical protein
MPNPETLQVSVRFQLNRDGSLRGLPQVVNQAAINLSNNRYLIAAADNARQAVIACEPYSFLPADRYDDWEDVVVNFDPAVMGINR